MTKRRTINGIRIMASDKKALVDILDRHGVHFFDKNVWDSHQCALLAAHLLVSHADDSRLIALTEEGLKLAQEYKAELEASRKRRNASARSRDSVMRSLGMRRTPYGWE